jgi:hypothetical protein
MLSLRNIFRQLLRLDGSGSGLDADLLDGAEGHALMPHPGFRTSAYYLLQGVSTLAVTAVAANNIYFAPHYFPPGSGVNRVGFEVTTAGAAGAKGRVGLFANTAGQPGALLIDCGEVTTDSTGIKEGVIPASSGGWFWIAFNFSVACTVRFVNISSQAGYVGSGSLSSAAVRAEQAFAYGAMPANAAPTFTAGSSTVAAVARRA